MQRDAAQSSGGSENALPNSALFERLYGELRALADRQIRAERPGLTHQPTAQEHEAYLRQS